MSASLLLLLAVAAAYLAAHVVFDWIARRFLIVSAAEYLVLGVLLGPQVAGVVGQPLLDSLAPVLTLALGWMGAIAGTRFELRRLLLIPAARFRIAFTESALTFAAVAGLEYFAIRWTFASSDGRALAAAVTLGAMAVVSSDVGSAVVSRILGARGAVIEQLELSSAINGLAGIALFGLLLCIQHSPAPAHRPLTATEWAVVSAGLGVIGGGLFHAFVGDTPEPDRFFVALAGGIVLISGAATYLRVSPLFAGFFFGVTLVNTTVRPESLINTLQRVEQPFYYVLLLFGGAAWVPSQRAWIAPVLLFVVMRAASKIGGSRLGARANGALSTLGPDWGRALLGQGRLALAIGLNFLHQDDPPYGNVVFTCAVMSILVTDFLSARLAWAALRSAPHEPVSASEETQVLPGVGASNAVATGAGPVDVPTA
jgi:Kef-type K+ transport system membrane component KefB